MRARAGRAVLFDDLGAEDVGRHQVGRELDAAELQVDRVGQRLDQQRLGQPGTPRSRQWPPARNAIRISLDHRVLPDDHLAQLTLQRSDQARGLGQGHRFGRAAASA